MTFGSIPRGTTKLNFMKILLVTLISFFCKAGTLTNYESTIRFKLQCPDENRQSCFFNVDIPMGEYLYISNDKKDTTILLIGDSQHDTYIYKTTGDFIFVD